MTSTHSLALVLFTTVTLIAVACGGDSGGDNPTPAPPPFDRQLLTAAVLRPEDIGPGYTVTGQFATGEGAPGAEAQAFETISTDGARRVQSSVVHYGDRARQRADFIDDRRILVGFDHTESNYQVPGADEAYFYRGSGLPTLSMWATIGEYIVFFQTSAIVDPAGAINRARFDELATLLMERVAALDTDPSAVTPVSGLESLPDMIAPPTESPKSESTPEAAATP